MSSRRSSRWGLRRVVDGTLDRLANDVAERVSAKQRHGNEDLDRIAALLAASSRLSQENLDLITAQVGSERRGVRRRLVISATLLILGAGSAVISAHIVPPVKGTISIPRARGIERVRVSGAPATAPMTVRGFGTDVVVGQSDPGLQVGRVVFLGVPVARANCEAKARQLSGSCDRRSGPQITYDELSVHSDEHLGVSLTARTVSPVDLEGSGVNEVTVSSAARVNDLHVECQTPMQTVSLSLEGGRPIPLAQACAHRHPPTLWLRVAFSGGPLPVSIQRPRTLSIHLPGKTATASVSEATASVGDTGATIRSPQLVPIIARTNAPRRGFRIVTGLDQEATTLTASVTSLSAPGIGQRVHSSLYRFREAWLLIGGAVLGLVCTLLAEAYFARAP